MPMQFDDLWIKRNYFPKKQWWLCRYSLGEITRNSKIAQIIGFLTPRSDEYTCLNEFYQNLMQTTCIQTKMVKKTCTLMLLNQWQPNMLF